MAANDDDDDGAALPSGPGEFIARPGWRHEVNQVAGIAYWRKGSGANRSPSERAGRLHELSDERREKAKHNGEIYRQRRDSAARRRTAQSA